MWPKDHWVAMKTDGQFSFLQQRKAGIGIGPKSRNSSCGGNLIHWEHRENSTSQTTSDGSLVYNYCSVNTMKWHSSRPKQSATMTDLPEDPVRRAWQAFPRFAAEQTEVQRGSVEVPVCWDLGKSYLLWSGLLLRSRDSANSQVSREFLVCF